MRSFDPFEELRRMQSRLNMLFEELERFSKRLIPTEEVAVDFPVDVMEDEESIKVVADLLV
ncbi:MAG: hypothetical protein OD814_001624 [Candidatus Alkanophagales archaeon MCA70_species_1]|nr:hypothetical protein [Candidatus Alkanophaga volatiphilum]